MNKEITLITIGLIIVGFLMVVINLPKEIEQEVECKVNIPVWFDKLTIQEKADFINQLNVGIQEQAEKIREGLK